MMVYQNQNTHMRMARFTHISVGTNHTRMKKRYIKATKKNRKTYVRVNPQNVVECAYNTVVSDVNVTSLDKSL